MAKPTRRLPEPTITRLSAAYRYLEELAAQGAASISSAKMGKALAIGSHNLRKDFNYLGDVGDTGSGYEVRKLMTHIAARLGFDEQRRVCVVGLGRLGSAILDNHDMRQRGFCIVAGFDSSINRLETITTPVPLHPAHEIADVVKSKAIELAIIAVPAKAAREVADRLMEAGISGIINFAPVIIKPSRPGVVVRNMDITGELRVLSALLKVNDQSLLSV